MSRGVTIKRAIDSLVISEEKFLKLYSQYDGPNSMQD